MLNSLMTELPLQRGTALLTAPATETKDAITIDTVVYRKAGQPLGAGSYGETHKCIGPGGQEFAIKAIHYPIVTANDVQGFLTEIIIQIILMKTSETEPGGPFVPKIFKVGFNPANKHGYIVSELMYRTVKSLVNSESKEKNNSIVPEMIKQVATILEFFGDKVQFNHRDFKCDNIMYIKGADGSRIYKLIDFGYSCLKWKNLEIRGKIDKLSGACFRKGRDLIQLMYELWNYYPLSKELFEWLYSNINVHVNKTCSVHKGCDFPLPIKSWQNTYSLFNTADVEPIYNTHTVLERVKLLQERANFKTRKNKPAAAAAPKQATPKKPSAKKPSAKKPSAKKPSTKKATPKAKIVVRVKDHKSNNLIVSFALKSTTPFSTIFKEFKKQVAWAKDSVLIFKYNATVIKQNDTPAGLGMTSPVDITVAAYDNQAAANAAQAPVAVAPVAVAPVAVAPVAAAKSCPPGKILNPKTGRCVKVDGWAAKHISKKTRKNK
jgi:hypothetical protein